MMDRWREGDPSPSREFVGGGGLREVTARPENWGTQGLIRERGAQSIQRIQWCRG